MAEKVKKESKPMLPSDPQSSLFKMKVYKFSDSSRTEKRDWTGYSRDYVKERINWASRPEWFEENFESIGLGFIQGYNCFPSDKEAGKHGFIGFRLLCQLADKMKEQGVLECAIIYAMRIRDEKGLPKEIAILKP